MSSGRNGGIGAGSAAGAVVAEEADRERNVLDTWQEDFQLLAARGIPEAAVHAVAGLPGACVWAD